MFISIYPCDGHNILKYIFSLLEINQRLLESESELLSEWSAVNIQ